jgi:AAA15 family ATPase/GTPase
MKARIWIDEITFKNGTILKLYKDSIVVFVGPNNAGKSQILNDINLLTRAQHGVAAKILDKIILNKQGDEKDFLKTMEARYKNRQYYYSENGGTRGLNEAQVRNHWNRFEPLKLSTENSTLTPFFLKQFNTLQRLSLVIPPANINIIDQASSHPIHFLKQDDDLEKKFSHAFKLAFGQNAIINHGAGNNIPIHIGDPPETTLTKDRVSKEYVRELLKLEMLHEQGDGMKSFAGVYMGLMVEDYSINIIDEPEAFLHPPQARLLGQMIAKNLEIDKQLFIATHDEDLLKGLLDHSDKRLIVVRVQRDGTHTKINVLENPDIQNIWSDPLLRHSNILSGLFHSKVILCESDGDCRFFSALSTAICENNGNTFPDHLYAESGGKARFPVIIRALKKLEVPLTVIGDFDLYDNEEPVRTMYVELEGNWDDIKKDFKTVKQSIDQKRPDLIVTDLKAEIDTIFSGISGQSMPEEKIKLIQKALKKSSAWTQAKSTGKHYLPAGAATTAHNRIQKKLKQRGIYVLEVGEMEAFDKTETNHGPKWVNAVLSKNLIKDTNLKAARAFVREAILGK